MRPASMAKRALNFLLLSSIVYWAVGAAHYVHERMEHCGGGKTLPAAHASDAGGAGRSGRQQAPPHDDDHDHCPTCQLLAHMQASHLLPSPPLCIHLQTDLAAPLADWLAPQIDFPCRALIRGPPVRSSPCL